MDIQQIIKSPSDTSDYKIILLKNRLKVLLISDPNSKLSYASMMVKTGSLLENNVYGLAHFLEHMLFQGNKKYPNGEKYFEYVNSHGGKTNAYTDLLNTCYYFSISNNYFENILDVFAHFFIDPTFDIAHIDKEINAVDAEYRKNMDIDGYQYRYALKLLAKDNHPFRNFDIGSNETLRINNIREELIKFYNKYYVANNMQLVLLHNESISKMEELLHLFINIPMSENIQQSIFNFGKPYMNGKIIKIVPTSTKPTSNTHTLLLTWAIKYNNYATYKVLRYIFYLLGRESTGSLAHILTNNSMIDNLHIHPIANFGDYITLCIDISMTAYGYKNIDVLMSIVMQYINTLRNIGFDEKNFKLFRRCTEMNYLFEEHKQLDERMETIMTNVCTYGAKLNESISLGSLICDESKKIRSIYTKIIDELCENNMNIIIGSPNCLLSANEKDKWFNFDYVIEENHLLDNKLNFKFDDIYYFNDEFVPEELIVYKKKESYTKPIQLNFPYGVLYKYENIQIPKVCVIIKLKLNKMYDNIINYLCVNIFIGIVGRELRGFLYDAILCNTTYNIFLERDNLIIKLYGFNDKMEKMVSEIIDCLLNINITFALFLLARDEYRTYLENCINEPPFEQLENIMDNAVYKNNYSFKEQYDVIGSIQFDDIKNVNMKNNTDIQCIVNGNITKRNCIKLGNLLQKLYNVESNDITSELKKMNGGMLLIKERNGNDEMNSLCAIAYCVDMNISVTNQLFIANYALSLLSNRIISDKFFNVMRTQKQLGYIVRNDCTLIGNARPIIIQKYYIQSSKYSPSELQNNMENFFTEMKFFIHSLGESDLRKYIDACIVNVLIEKTNIIEKTMEIFRMVMNKNYTFDQKTKIVDALKRINNEMLKDFYDKNILSGLAKKIIVYIN